MTDKDGGVSGEEARDTGGRGESDAGTSGAGTGGAGTGGTISTGGAGGVAGEDVGEAGDSSSVTPDSGGIRICGSRGLPPCPEGEFCDFAEGSDCGADDRGGQCKTKPSICDDIFKPVCGCDGQTYSNACVANSAGISVDHTGDCAIATADNDCDHRKVLCKMMEPICPFGQVPSVSGSCYGPCVPIETCVCSTSEQCPDSSQYTCHISAGHCGPYV
ncbi:MAG: hypothetical protein JXA30_06055 [Deltaproteobacteria bacterium]|nr:hypothetical protein [Deltaproteobacteria bacterium]